MNSREIAEQQSAFMWLLATSEESRELPEWLPCLRGITATGEMGRESTAGAEMKAGQMGSPLENTNASTMAGKDLIP